MDKEKSSKGLELFFSFDLKKNPCNKINDHEILTIFLFWMDFRKSKETKKRKSALDEILEVGCQSF